MNQLSLDNKDIVELTQDMLKAGYKKHEIQEHLIGLGVSFAFAHETVENSYRYNQNSYRHHQKSKRRSGKAKQKSNFWRFAIRLVSIF